MADQLDNRPVFTIVMGCNGAGKSAWKRENYDRLPEHYFDQDSIAGGIGDWNSESARARTREYVDIQINQAIAARRDFGIESTYSGRPGRAMVERAKAASYRVEGVYIGTDSPEINAERVAHRVKTNTGHHVDAERLPERYRFSLSNLRKTAELFDALEVVDNSDHDEERRPFPKDQIYMENGVAGWRAEPMRPWCADWLARFEKSLSDRQRRAESSAPPPKEGPGLRPPSPGFLAGAELDHSSETAIVRNKDAPAGGAGQPESPAECDAAEPDDDEPRGFPSQEGS